MDRKTRALALAAILGVAVLVPKAQEADPPGTGTFSILGYDPATGELGAAVQSRVFSVGNGSGSSPRSRPGRPPAVIRAASSRPP